MSEDQTTPYAVYYEDNSYMIYDLTDKDFNDIKASINGKCEHAFLSVGILALKDIRAVIKQKPTKPRVEEEVIGDGDPIMDLETAQWLREHRNMDIEGGN